MRNALFLGVFLLLAVLAGGAQAYQLAYKDPADTTRWYRNEMTIKGSMTVQPMNMTLPIDGSVKLLITEKVVSVNDDGTATIAMQFSDGTVTMTVPGVEEPMTLPFLAMTMSYRRAPSGKMTDLKIEGQPDAAFAIPGMEEQMKMLSGSGQGIEFPAGDLKPGDTWETTQAFEFIPGRKAEMKITNTFKGPQTVDGVEYLLINTDVKLDIKFTVPAGEQAVTMEQSFSMVGKLATLFDDRAGEINRSLFNAGMDVKATMPASDGQTVVTTGTFTMSGSMKKVPAPEGK